MYLCQQGESKEGRIACWYDRCYLGVFPIQGKLTYYNGGKVGDNSFVPVSIGLKDIEYIKRMETAENEKSRDRVHKGNER